MIDASASITDFLNAASSKQPTPGGGAVAALAGALAASMGEMVLAYSVAKKDLLAHAQTNQAALHDFTNARKLLVQLMIEDQQAYAALTGAKKATKPQSEIDAIAEKCIAVPQAIGTTALAILEISNGVASTSNKWLLSDLAVCGELATATVRCAVHNINVNLPEIRDNSRRQKLHGDGVQLLEQAIAQIRKLIPIINTIQNAS